MKKHEELITDLLILNAKQLLMVAEFPMLEMEGEDYRRIARNIYAAIRFIQLRREQGYGSDQESFTFADQEISRVISELALNKVNRPKKVN